MLVPPSHAPPIVLHPDESSVMVVAARTDGTTLKVLISRNNRPRKSNPRNSDPSFNFWTVSSRLMVSESIYRFEVKDAAPFSLG